MPTPLLCRTASRPPSPACRWRPAILRLTALLCGAALAGSSAQADVALVREGKPAATIIVTAAGPTAKSDRAAANVLVEWVAKITDARLPIANEPQADTAPVYLGAAAVGAGLKLADIQSPSNEGLRIRCEDRRLLLAGQDAGSTLKAVCRLLEELGCRYLIDHPLGEVFPRQTTLVVKSLDLSEQPKLLSRALWGSGWSGNTLWKTWNGCGGVKLSPRHAWGQYIPPEEFERRPEWFRQRDGKRIAGDWFCTSNPELRQAFAAAVLKRIEQVEPHPSLSPPDGIGYCQCDACQAQDDPRSIEPSSGRVNMTNRYLDFYQQIARQAKSKHPASILNFYCYFDYTQPPTSGIQLESNLCAWIAPFRYCRYHAIGDPRCGSRHQLADALQAWSQTSSKLAYRTYNYNLFECTAPVPKISVWKHDFPYLHGLGAIAVNNETLPSWFLYGPHIYLSARLAYDPTADADAIMDDYYRHFYGPAAGPMKQFWTTLDQQVVALDCHSEGFFALHRLYRPELLKQCETLLAQATRLTPEESPYRQRVTMTGEGITNARQYLSLRAAMNRGDIGTALRTYEQLVQRNRRLATERLGTQYTETYLNQYLGRALRHASAALAAPAKLNQTLPDRWRMEYDPDDAGLRSGFHTPKFDDSGWPLVATFSDTLNVQGREDRKTILWYRTRFDLDDAPGKRQLVFLEVDGRTKVFLNGRLIGASPEGDPLRAPFTVDITAAAAAGENVLAVRVDHTRPGGLLLGGILRPVLVVDAGR